MRQRVLVTGANGQLGQSLQRLSALHMGLDFLFTDVDTLDICDRKVLQRFLADRPVEYIVNCAAYTAVDQAEEDEERCRMINCTAVANLAEAAAQIHARVLHVSTDYVFDGKNFLPYKETDKPAPMSVYGRTKLAGEEALLHGCPDAVIVRTSWLYSEYGKNFMKTMLRVGAECEKVRVVFDQIGSPTYAGDLAAALLTILDEASRGIFHPGIYHYCNEGVCSWYDFAAKIMQLANLSAKVLPIETKEYPSRAARPHFSVLNKAKIKATYSLEIPHWESSLRKCLENRKKVGF